MKLSNKKSYCVSTVLASIAPTLRSVVWFDGNGIGDIKAEAGTIPSEADIDAAGNLLALQDAKALKKTEVNAKRSTATLKPTFYNGSSYDPIFLLDIDSGVDRMSDTATKLIITEENTEENLTKAELISRITHLRNRNTTLVQGGRIMKDAIESLTTVEDVNAYTVEF